MTRFRVAALAVCIGSIPLAARGDPPDDGQEPPGTPTCGTYCRDVMGACTGALARYTSAQDCDDQCNASPWEAGKPGDVSGDTLACRATWASKAATDPATACPNAGYGSRACGSVMTDPIVMVAPALDPSSTMVLGLYDAADDKGWRGAARHAQVDILQGRVAPALKRLGLTLKIVNMARGTLPDEALVASSRAIVTCFLDTTLINAPTYAAWLRAQIDAGRRVAILGEYGAYLDKASKKAVDLGQVNRPLEALGVQYIDRWEKNAKLIKLKAADKSMFPGGVPSPKTARHYRLFKVQATDLTVHLSLEVAKVPDSESAVVFTGPRGGMVLVRYDESQDGKRQYLDMLKFLSLSLGVSAP